ncbi:thioredoxin-dependent thiol peroxidase [Candidatus Woesebacteria bacterium]|nr:thioredoxin-dependent thiol peroxidase [Candidatus Woesebacteria bacterium]
MVTPSPQAIPPRKFCQSIFLIGLFILVIGSTILFIVVGKWGIMQHMDLKVGQTSPSFALPDQDEKKHRLSDYRGQWVLIYFYPKDDTPGCTKEACGIRDNFSEFGKLDVKVVGISADSPARHKKFAEKYDLPFTLLADEEKKVLGKYGVWARKKMMGREYMGILRTSFLVDPKGKIAKIYENVKPEGHAEEILKDLAQLKG